MSELNGVERDVIESSESYDFSEFFMDLILASNSPRRRMLLALTGWNFVVMPADVDETIVQGESSQEYVIRLAVDKARAVVARTNRRAVIISADTTVVDGDEILGKPIDSADAERMLRQLRGNTHRVFTGLAVLSSDGNLQTELCCTDVPMRFYSDDEMYAYIASGDPLDKAGAYAIQHAGFHPVERLKGCFANVVGFPLCHLLRLLQKMGIEPELDVPGKCQAALEYQCPIYDSILREEL